MREQILALITAIGEAATDLQERRWTQTEPGGFDDAAYVTGEVPQVRPAP